MNRIASVAIIFALSGCVGNGVEFGGIGAPMEPPAATVPCAGLIENSFDISQRGPVNIPDDVAMFFYMSDNYALTRTMLLTYDLPPNGRPANIRYAGSPEDLRHTTRQKLIRAASDTLQQSVYTWNGDPTYATGCEFGLVYMINWARSPDGVVESPSE